MLDIIILSVPGTISKSVPAAPALLKASVNQAGFSCQTLDFNIRLYKESLDLNSIETYFSTGLNSEYENIAKQLVEKWVFEIINLNPRYVGISVFTYQNRIATRLFCEELKKRSNIKIILGGQGLSDGGIEGSANFGKLLVEQELADFWIRSEGEISLVELLRGNYNYPGINSNTFDQIDNLDQLPFSNFDDYNLDDYESRSLPVVGSRGCVRSCSFCDIHEHWKYRYRAGRSLAEEIIWLNKKYNVYDFKFMDSLINGNLKEFKIFIKILAEYNKTHDKKITWSSQFIVRSEKNTDEEFWNDLADSGASMLSIGVETGSDKVRAHMNKKFTNADLDYTMQMLDKYNITCVFLMIVGYPTETDQDFQCSLDMFTRYKSLANRIIKNVNIGSTLGILPGTPLYNTAHQSGIELDKYENNWLNWNQPDLTITKRLERRRILNQHLLDVGYILESDSTEHMLKVLESKQDLFETRIKLKKIIHLKQIR